MILSNFGVADTMGVGVKKMFRVWDVATLGGGGVGGRGMRTFRGGGTWVAEHYLFVLIRLLSDWCLCRTWDVGTSWTSLGSFELIHCTHRRLLTQILNLKTPSLFLLNRNAQSY